MSAEPRPLALAFGGLLALAAAMGVGRFVYTPILPNMIAELGLTEGQAGLIASSNFAGYLAGALLASTPVLRGSRRFWLLTGVAGSALTTLAMGLVSGMALFLVLRFAGGVASAFVLVFASTLVLERLALAGRGGLSSVHFAGVGTGIAFSAVMVAGLAAFGLGWRWQWGGTGAAALLAFGAVAVLVPGGADPLPAKKTAGGGGGLPALVLSYGLFGFGYVITATFLVAIVREAAEVRWLEPMVWLAVGLSAIPSVALWTWAGGRLGVLRVYAWACLLEAVGVAASVLWISPAGILLAAVLLGGTFMALTALGFIAARQLSAGDPRRVLAVMTAAFGLGQIIGPVFAGTLYDRSGSFLPSSLTAAAALVIAAGLAFLLVRKGAESAAG